LDGVAHRLAESAPQASGAEPLPERLDRAVDFLNEHGYAANWQHTGGRYLLHTCNCPYEALAKANPELCAMDLTLTSSLLRAGVERVSRVLDGAGSCSYGVSPSPADSGDSEFSRTQSG
jgi:predicted ArsR family transcriptional regulator